MPNYIPSDDEEEYVKNGEHGTDFLLDHIVYHFPKYLCTMSNKKKKLTFHILVEDAYPGSSVLKIDDEDKVVRFKFCVISLDPDEIKHYTFMVKLPVLSVEDIILSLRANKVVLTIPFTPEGDQEVTWYLCGKTDQDLVRKSVHTYEQKLVDTSIEDDSADEAPAQEELQEAAQAVLPWLTSEL